MFIQSGAKRDEHFDLNLKTALWVGIARDGGLFWIFQETRACFFKIILVAQMAPKILKSIYDYLCLDLYSPALICVCCFPNKLAKTNKI
jgi:hypothetical protein